MTPADSSPSATSPCVVRVLVVEDSPLNQQVALKQLERLGYHSAAASDGLQALEALARSPFDIILMDCQMPEMNGYEAAWQIRHREAQGAFGDRPRVRIIAMTATTEAEGREKCLAAGMDDFVSKPVQLPELEAVLRRATSESATDRQLEQVLDPVILAGLRQLRVPGKPDPLVGLIDLFVQEAPAELDAMQRSIRRNDAASLAEVTSAATALMGSSRNLGARELAMHCAEILQITQTSLLSDALPVLDAARDEFKRARAVLQSIRQEAVLTG